MILPIVAYGFPVLKKKAEEINADYAGFDQLIEDMFETMYEANYSTRIRSHRRGFVYRLFVSA